MFPIPAVKDSDVMLPDGEKSYYHSKRNLKLGFESSRMFG